MPPCQSLCFNVVLFLLLSHAFSCTTFEDVVSSEQRRYLSYQQRGAPREFTEPFFKVFLDDIYSYVRKRSKQSDLSRVCLTSEDLNGFYGKVHDSSAIDRELVNLRARFPHLPYIPESSSKRMPTDPRLERQSLNYSHNISGELSRGKVKSAAILPETSLVLYDPAKEANLEVYQAHASRAPRMTAIRLLRIVTGLVITLELAEVPRANSTQMLRHAVAWLSTVFRALQHDGCHVQVPALYIPFYQDEFQRLMRYGRHRVPEVSEYLVEKTLGNELDAYCKIDAWGRLEIIKWGEGSSSDTWTIEETLFNPKFLANMARQIRFKHFDARNYPPFDPYEGVGGMEGWEVEYTRDNSEPSYEIYPYEAQGSPSAETYRMAVTVPEPRLNTSERQGNMCNQPIYEFYPRPGATWEQKCCAAICCNAALMMQISLSVHDCCGDCNQAFCHTQGSQLAGLAMVHLQPYGCNDGGYVPVSL